MHIIKKLPLGTLINALAVVIGSLIGLYLQNTLSTDIQNIVFQAIGLATILIGIKMMLELPDGYMLIVVFSLIIGAIIGEGVQLDMHIQSFSEYLKGSFTIADTRFSEALITAFLLFCIGSMTILGALDEGLKQNRQLLSIKAVLDGFTSIALSASLGIGVLFSVIPLLLFQGGITLLARRLKPILDNKTLGVLSATGGLLIFAIAINILQIGAIQLENLMPSLLVSIIFSRGYQKLQSIRASSR